MIWNKPKKYTFHQKKCFFFFSFCSGQGAWENWRDDAGDFPESVLGNDYEGWPGERWLDVRDLKTVLPIMQRRLRDAVARGCQGIDPDNMNGFSVNTGFPITFNDQLVYNRMIVREARRLGMLAGLKNTPEQGEALEPFIDFVVVEVEMQEKEISPKKM